MPATMEYGGLQEVMLDTNVLMHFAFLQDYPYRSYPELASKLDVWINKVVIRELDKHKDGHKDQHMKKRCGQQLHWIENAFRDREQVDLGPGIVARLILRDDIQSRMWRADDQFLWAAREMSGGGIVISNDTLVRLSTRQMGMTALVPVRSEECDVST